MQKAYLRDVIARFKMPACNSSHTPMEHKLQLPLTKVHVDPGLRHTHLHAIGSLMYAMLGTCPDLAYLVGYLPRYAGCPQEVHWEAVKRVLRYLQDTLDYGIL